ncbi:MAG: cytochrome c biogenesis protein ResB [Thermodesulfobacteriota bacterium]
MTTEKSDSSPMDKIWDFFTSIKLAIFTLIVLAVASIFGTIVEQNLPLEKYREIYEDWAFELLLRLNMFDMYHSWWFLLLLVLFTVNLTCCTVDRFPRAWKTVRNPRTKMDEGHEKALPHVERWRKKGTVEEWVPRYTVALSALFAKPLVSEEAGEVHLYAERGTASRFGVYVTHVSIIIIFLGAIVGNVLGFKGFVGIPEGDSVSRVPVRGGARLQDLGFDVRCNRFVVEMYPTGQPKAYISDLSVIEGGREVLRKKDVVVNDPLRYKGVWFYQSSYGEAGGAVARIQVIGPDGSPQGALSLPPNHPVPIPGYGVLRGVNYDQNFQGKGPALEVVVEKPGASPAGFWLFQRNPDLDRARKDSLAFAFGGLAPRMYTGLQVSRDPGVNVVWLGCALMVVGIIMAFFLSHQRVWLRLSPGTDGRVTVVLGGAANRNRLAFEKAFEKIQAGAKAVGE